MPGRSYNVAFSGNQYKFGSKELDDENNLNWYHFEARRYDPEIARFTTIDPFSGLYPSISPYVYVANNPIRFIDTNGMIIMEYAREYGTTGNGLTANMTQVEGTVDAIHNDVAGRDAIATYTTNGTHMEGSAHYDGNAYDLRTRDLTQTQIDNIVTRLRNELGGNYDVIFEGDHIHVEYDPSEPVQPNPDPQPAPQPVPQPVPNLPDPIPIPAPQPAPQPIPQPAPQPAPQQEPQVPPRI